MVGARTALDEIMSAGNPIFPSILITQVNHRLDTDLCILETGDSN
jgi:hypothetical protein